MNPSNASEKAILAQRFLTLIRVGFLGVLLEVGQGGGGVKLPPVENLLELC